MFDISRYYQTLFFLVFYQACRCAAPAIFSFLSFLFFLLFPPCSRSTHRRQHRSTPEDSLLRRPRERERERKRPPSPPSTPGRSYTMASERSVNNGSFPIKNSVCALARLLRTLLCFSSLFSIYTGTPLRSPPSPPPPLPPPPPCVLSISIFLALQPLRSRTVSGRGRGGGRFGVDFPLKGSAIFFSHVCRVL